MMLKAQKPVIPGGARILALSLVGENAKSKSKGKSQKANRKTAPRRLISVKVG